MINAVINQKQGLGDGIQSLDTAVHQLDPNHSYEYNQCKLKYIDLQIKICVKNWMQILFNVYSKTKLLKKTMPDEKLIFLPTINWP